MLLEVYQKDNRNKDVQTYESVTYGGVEYNLHDCVIFYRAGEIETYIAKIVEIIDTADVGKQLRVVWFFRPSEIRNYLRDYEPRWNEIFLASGEGKGLSTTNILEAVLGKCTVVCISKDQRNPPPSKDELRTADYIFSCTFDVGKLKISRKFPDEIHGFRVENFFNKRKGGDLTPPPSRKPLLSFPTRNSNSLSKEILDKVVDAVTNDRRYDNKDSAAKVEDCFSKRKDGDLTLAPAHKPHLSYPTGNSNSLSKQMLDKAADAALTNDRRYDNKDSVTKEPHVSSETLNKVRCSANVNLAAKTAIISEEKIQERISSRLVKQKDKRKYSGQFSSSDPLKLKPDKRVRFSNEVLQEPAHLNLAKDMDKNSREASSLVEQDQATRIDNDAEVRTWFKKSVTPWDERLQKARERGTLVLLENLDPTCSSSEVEEIFLSGFNERVQVKMIEQTPFSCHLYGKAFVIFKSNDAANTVINKLNQGCLIVTDQRPVVGVVGTVRKPDESKLFTGHYKIRPKRLTEDMRSAVATSHCSQENTIEYSMAMEWRILQEKSERWWKLLHEKQAKEMMELKKQLKINI